MIVIIIIISRLSLAADVPRRRPQVTPSRSCRRRRRHAELQSQTAVFDVGLGKCASTSWEALLKEPGASQPSSLPSKSLTEQLARSSQSPPHHSPGQPGRAQSRSLPVTVWLCDGSAAGTLLSIGSR
ncbi:unnamed protein product [Lampetra fluviatilis]